MMMIAVRPITVFKNSLLVLAILPSILFSTIYCEASRLSSNSKFSAAAPSFLLKRGSSRGIFPRLQQSISIGKSSPFHSRRNLLPPVLAYNDVFEEVLFVECGFGCDQHGQNATKAAVRACRNAIEFNSLPGIRKVIPGGKDNMKLQVQLGVPVDADEVDLEQVAKVFPYGKLQPIIVEKGGLIGKSGIALAELGDKNEDMIIVVACISVGY
mmetsp:Transcript_896/g.1439  ORF Transcript_896/g.1439 Transcript_896/m.1439 type:complete len:212 (+) Transcript_896:67-702(+)